MTAPDQPARAAEVPATESSPSPDRQLAARLFNRTWDLLDNQARTPDDDDEMVHCAHASRFHWSQAPECQPHHLAVGEWQCSRVYSVLGRAEPALWHARRCLERCQEGNVTGFFMGAAYEALARAHQVAGDEVEAARWEAQAREIAETLTDKEDRDQLLADLDSLPNASNASNASNADST
jgi:hypothetical protein